MVFSGGTWIWYQPHPAAASRYSQGFFRKEGAADWLKPPFAPHETAVGITPLRSPRMLHYGRGEVDDALARGRPVVALETAVLTHGLPRPRNLEAAMAMERAVREAGAIPATVGVIEGRLTVGLSAEELERLGAATDARKASARDLAAILARGESAGTTVAATLVACRLANIPVFATGGIGGVHRGWEQTLDVSADLREIASTPCCIVCCGAKTILDVPATLEMLETLGVPVLGYRTDAFPQFYSSGRPDLAVCVRVDSVKDAASVCAARWTTLRQGGGLVLAAPPPPAHALDHSEMDAAIGRALAAAEAAGVRGPALTPFLLRAVADFSSGRALEANLALLASNARLAGELAAALAPSLRPARAPGGLDSR